MTEENASWEDESSVGETGIEVSTGEKGSIEFTDQEIRQEVLDLKDRVETSYWLLSAALKQVYDKELFRNWGFDTFRAYVDEDLVFGIRKALYLLNIQKWLEKLPPAIQEWAHEIGWTKCRMLQHVITAENATTWRDRIDGKTVEEITEILKNGGDGSGGEGGGGSGGGDGDGDGDLEANKKYTFGMKGNQIAVVDMAINRAMELGDTDKPSNALSLICADYLAATGTTLNTSDYLKTIQASLGLQLIAAKVVKDGEDEIVFGYDYLNKKIGTETPVEVQGDSEKASE